MESSNSGAHASEHFPFSCENLPKPLHHNGRYKNPWPCNPLPPGIRALLKWQMEPNSNKKLTKQELNELLPVVKPQFTNSVDGVRTTWLGHATVLVQMGDITVITDPIFSQRCSPSQWFGPKRYRDPPCQVADLPQIDAVVISHNHYDHLDTNSVYDLNKRFGRDLHWFVPMGLAGWFHSSGCESVTEMDWWEEKTLPKQPSFKFVFTPAQHWSKRTAMDDNKTLWGSWCVVGPKSRFYFSGDTGYCGVFKLIGELYGPFDIAAIPIGCYSPRWFMHPQHIDPAEALKVHNDIQSTKSLAIHWGTFALANELYMAPKTELAECIKAAGMSPDEFITLNPGESCQVQCQLSVTGGTSSTRSQLSAPGGTSGPQSQLSANQHNPLDVKVESAPGGTSGTQGENNDEKDTDVDSSKI